MADPITFTARSHRFALPFLFAGQAQKEFYVNEALSLIDALLHPVIEGVTSAPPSETAEGACWLVDADPSGSWIGHAGAIACFQAGSWLFVAPHTGMCVVDRASGAEWRYVDGWRVPASVAPPAGGSVVDQQARVAIASLITALAESGLIREG